MSKRLLLVSLLAAGALALALAACGGDDEEAAGGDEVTVELAELDDSGQSGTATLTSEGEGTSVTVELSGSTEGVQQPAHIHPGTCENLDPTPQYPLENVVDGSATSTVDATIEELTSGEFAINVHKSGEEADVYVACGNIG